MENQPDNFIKIMEGLVSNDSNKRNKNLSELNKILVDIIANEKDVLDSFGKIWKSLFYCIYTFNQVFWNTDKPVNQKLTADDIAFKLELFGNKNLIVDYIKCFLTEFGRKWPKIDFLRLDKYIMMLQTVLKKFFELCLEIKTLENISAVVDHMKNIIDSDFYNFSFTFNVLKCFSHLIEIIFEKGLLNEDKFKSFSQQLIELFLSTRDTREIESFKDNIMKKLSEKVKIYPNLKQVLLECMFERASCKEDFPENKRRLLFKFYKHLKYLVINEDTGEIDEFPLDEEKPIDEVDPVNACTLKTKYTNLNIARSLKKKIINSVIKHNKRAHKLMLEWQQQQQQQKEKEKENNKEGENENKIRHEEQSIPETINNNNNINDDQIETKQSETNCEKIEISHEQIIEDCPQLIEPDVKEANNNDFHLLEEKNHVEEKPKKKNKTKQNESKRQQKEDSKDNEIDDDFDEFVESLKMKINSNTKLEEEEIINSINNNFLPKKRKSAQLLEKGPVKRVKANDVVPVSNMKNKSKKRVTFNLAENLVTKYDLQKPITLTWNKVVLKDNSNGMYKGVLKNPKKVTKNKAVNF